MGMTKVNRMKFEIMKITESMLSYSDHIYRYMSAKMSHYQQVCLKLVRDDHREKLAAIAVRGKNAIKQIF